MNPPSSIQQRVEAIRSSDSPLQDQEHALLELRIEASSIEETLFIQANADYISDIMANRNIEGATLERLHRTGEAIELYEANIKDHYKNSHSYERLRTLYSRAGKYIDALRVCKAYLEFGQNDETVKKKYRDWIAEQEQTGSTQ